MSDVTNDQSQPTPQPQSAEGRDPRKAVWFRGLWMLVLLILFSVAQTLLVITAVLQFAWMLFTRKHNENIADFGEKLGNWMAMNARFQAVSGEEKPFPWSEWK
ncbi:uncharacterized protein DUF4389 [Rhodovulum imhoffii]|uniref:Uncharacterized protein DUF4389 n=1 Tax=Rhodovulum imhoffii TaxID=365340 RepID=A0A2T5BR57_9RHOB|nr:DUF4389 domain-containing protein [Rhodovulum imhoffii]MBK5934399.1 hypothetical protein [Rhodovulum imhoffii]PTN01745.1 uncharacterized protein DUF4389 [Rhodovulum imhoffii]